MNVIDEDKVTLTRLTLRHMDFWPQAFPRGERTPVLILGVVKKRASLTLALDGRSATYHFT